MGKINTEEIKIKDQRVKNPQIQSDLEEEKVLVSKKELMEFLNLDQQLTKINKEIQSELGKKNLEQFQRKLNTIINDLDGKFKRIEKKRFLENEIFKLQARLEAENAQKEEKLEESEKKK
jgi:hypothetical protein